MFCFIQRLRSNVSKTASTVNVPDQAKPLSTNIIGFQDMMRDYFIRSVFTALTLPEISFLIPVFQLVLVYRLLPFCLFMWPRVHHDRGSERVSRRVLRDKYGDSHATRDSFVGIRHLALRVFEPK